MRANPHPRLRRPRDIRTLALAASKPAPPPLAGNFCQAAERFSRGDGFEAHSIGGHRRAGRLHPRSVLAELRQQGRYFLRATRGPGSAQRIAEVNALLRLHQNPAQRLRALRQYYAQNAKDRLLVLLSLEFKLFAVRHPEAAARLRARRQGLADCGGKLLQRVAKSLARSLPVSSAAAQRRSAVSRTPSSRTPGGSESSFRRGRPAPCSNSSLTQF